MTDTSTKQATSPFLVAALYHFVSVPHFESLRGPLQQLCEDNGVKGTLLLAHEGINGTIADIASQFGCDTLQGFFFSKPVSAEDITERLMEARARKTSGRRVSAA